jgi:hypothetical protein
LFSAAIDCSSALGSQRSSGQTAAELPPKVLSVKASTWMSRIRIAILSVRAET